MVPEFVSVSLSHVHDSAQHSSLVPPLPSTSVLLAAEELFPWLNQAFQLAGEMQLPSSESRAACKGWVSVLVSQAGWPRHGAELAWSSGWHQPHASSARCVSRNMLPATGETQVGAELELNRQNWAASLPFAEPCSA